MTFVIGDRTQETSTITGTGTYDLNGTVSGMQDFVTGIGDGNETCYVAVDGTDWEIGIGTVTSGTPNELSRDRIIDSSNSGSEVDWGGDTITISSTVAGEHFVPPVLTKSTTFSMTDLRHNVVYEATAASANYFATLPDSTTVEPGFMVTVQNMDASDYRVNVTAYGASDKLEGSTSLQYSLMPTMAATFRLSSAGDNWQIVNSGRNFNGSLLTASSDRSAIHQYEDTNGFPYVEAAAYNFGKAECYTTYGGGSYPVPLTGSVASSYNFAKYFELNFTSYTTLQFKNLRTGSGGLVYLSWRRFDFSSGAFVDSSSASVAGSGTHDVATAITNGQMLELTIYNPVSNAINAQITVHFGGASHGAIWREG